MRARCEFALNRGFAGRWIIAIPPTDERSIASRIVIWKKTLHWAAETFFSDPYAKVLKGFPTQEM